MTIGTRIFRLFLAAVLLVSLLAGPLAASAAAAEMRAVNPTADEVVALISDTYKQIKTLSGRRSFYNRCSTMVNYTSVVLGMQSQIYSCNGSGEYNLYEGITATDQGYNVHLYSAKKYSLGEALNAISENGTKDVYNIIIGWQSGSSYAARRYGHTCYIFAILDGYVYFYESYGLSLGGKYYREGAPIVCSIAEFARYYNRWARFEGAVHFSTELQENLSQDNEPPRVTGLRATGVSEEGFDLNFQVSDDVAMRKVEIRVWTQGQTEADALVIEPEITDDTMSIRIDPADFGGFVGNYFVGFTALDQAGNTKEHVLKISLYDVQDRTGTYRVLSEAATVCNSPCDTVNGTDTAEYTLSPAESVLVVGEYVNDQGQTWYLLTDGCWLNADAVIRELQWYEVVDFLTGLLNGSISDLG